MATTKAVLIIGGSGFIGSHLAARLVDQYKVFTTYNSHKMTVPGATPIFMNLADKERIKRILYVAKADIIIYAAGKEDLDWAENNARDAELLLSAGVSLVSAASDVLQSRFIYISSCYVFDGKKGNFKENDSSLPNTSLGKIKAAGENYAKSKNLNYMILRSSPLIGRGGHQNPSFIDRLTQKLSRGERIELVDDQIFSYSSVYQFSEFVSRVVESTLRNKTFHFGGRTRLTPYEFGLLFAERFKFEQRLIVPIRNSGRLVEGSLEGMSDYSLNCNNAVNTYKINPQTASDTLEDIFLNISK